MDTVTSGHRLRRPATMKLIMANDSSCAVIRLRISLHCSPPCAPSAMLRGGLTDLICPYMDTDTHIKAPAQSFYLPVLPAVQTVSNAGTGLSRFKYLAVVHGTEPALRPYCYP